MYFTFVFSRLARILIEKSFLRYLFDFSNIVNSLNKRFSVDLDIMVFELAVDYRLRLQEVAGLLLHGAIQSQFRQTLHRMVYPDRYNYPGHHRPLPLPIIALQLL